MDPAQTTTDTIPLEICWFFTFICHMAKGINVWYSAAGKFWAAGKMAEERLHSCMMILELQMRALRAFFVRLVRFILFFFPEKNRGGRENGNGGSQILKQKDHMKNEESGHGETKNCDYPQDASTLTF